ncbi:glycerophosphoryl diester phosphodiesterase membrane domain-containing protein [Companilactobacillus mishanensis]|uniref:glycerophosphoryl diester phosphodiesterase membrane domain-containing protein n=1 Tax=Companilactobacillus mishanensis TaxID=2486008 RepID=UPI0012952996|nr:glycerophosphodiester phosphodiesterase [Companilactobacillus mishanensis]MQS89912.1 glycerophosphodiester phosphodiesterase [Companilactobacillus mishanensis]
MLALQTLFKQNGIFWKRWWSYTQILILVELSIDLILIPILNFLSNTILNASNIAYVSYTNLGYLFTHKIPAMLELLLLLLFIMILVFTQFAVTLISFRAIRSDLNLGWRVYLKDLWKQIWPLPYKTFWFFLFYFLLIIPIGGVGLNSPLLDKVKIPTFITDWIFQEHLPLGILLSLIYLVILYVGIRWIFVLPNIIFDKKGARAAIRLSWAKTRHKTLHYLLYIVILTVIIGSVLIVLFGIILGIQWIFDAVHFFPKTVAIVNMTVVQIINAGSEFYFTSLIALLLLSETSNLTVSSEMKQAKHRRWPWFAILAISISGFASYSALYFNNLLLQKPETISHRGVDDGNGVQNTIPAMKKTAKEKPDYIEMDIQETKDHKFIVLHDTNLKKLAEINKKPSQMTLAQLKKVKVHENGYTAYLASFDDYLNAANKSHQKLLIEFKKTSSSSNDFVKKFSELYDNKLRKNHDMVHSLDYKFIQQSKNDEPKVPANYILSFNLSGVPVSKANGFTMEYTTLNDTFVYESHFENKNVYAWTVNETDDMDKMIFLGVDGIITDNLSDLNDEIDANINTKSYALRILNYIVTMKNPAL